MRVPAGTDGGAVHADQHVQPARLGGAGQHLGGEGGGGDDRRAGAGVAQDVGVVAGEVGAVGRHRHGADRHQRRVGDVATPAGFR
jgi:hypothetical protein